jgi:hypothetical protein
LRSELAISLSKTYMICFCCFHLTTGVYVRNSIPHDVLRERPVL